MGQYENFAYIYDDLMENIDYKKWLHFIIDQCNKQELKIKSMCELACGTGTMTQLLASHGYDMIGIDLSEDMLMVARDKLGEEDLGILYLQQDMREFKLYGSIDCIVATCDSLNYVDKEGLIKVFEQVQFYLNPNGLFIFDLNTEHKFESNYGNKTFSELGEDFAYLWENQYDKATKINEYFISFFVENEENTYDRFDEYHKEFVHDIETIKLAMKKTELKIIGVYDDYSNKEENNKSERVTYVLKKES